MIAGMCGGRTRAVEVDNLSGYVVEPISSRMILPDTDPVPGQLAKEVSITAAPGEYEPASIVLRAKRDLEDVRIEVSDLTNDKALISAEHVDIKVVKCWYQATTAWHGIHTRPKEGRKVLVPELLLNDDSLVRVDRERQRNYLKLGFKDRDKYVWISNPNEPDGDKMKVLSVEDYPVKDSPDLLGVDIATDTNKQFWITVKAPADAEAGVYKGKILVKSDNVPVASLRLQVRVLPYTLEEPATRYDVTKPFISSIYYRGKLGAGHPEGSVSSEYKSQMQLAAELQNMLAHNITNPTCYQGFDSELLGRYLEIKNEAGMTSRQLYYLGVSANSNPKTIAKLMEYVRQYGLKKVYFYGIDEARGDRLKAQRLAWAATRQAGGRVFVAGGIGRNFEAMGDIQDLHICAGRPRKDEAEKWHSVGHKVFCYAWPQGGPEDPELWRRHYGLALWMADYDGACTYCYQHSFGNIWNDFDHYHYRDHVVAYPTVDGVIDTIAFEGYREAIDDIRYATTLTKAMKGARKSRDADMMKTAEAAEKWLSEIDPMADDLNRIRAKIIEYTLAFKGHGH